MELSPWLVYLVMQLDKIESVLVGIAVISCAICGGSWLIMLMCMHSVAQCPNGNDGDKKMIEPFRRVVKALTPCSLFAVIACMLLPSTKTIAAMYVIPKIANSDALEQVMEDSGDLYKLGVDALKEKLTNKKEGE